VSGGAERCQCSKGLVLYCNSTLGARSDVFEERVKSLYHFSVVIFQHGLRLTETARSFNSWNLKTKTTHASIFQLQYFPSTVSSYSLCL